MSYRFPRKTRLQIRSEIAKMGWDRKLTGLEVLPALNDVVRVVVCKDKSNHKENPKICFDITEDNPDYPFFLGLSVLYHS